MHTFMDNFHQEGKYSAQIADQVFNLFHPYRLIIKIWTAAQVVVEILRKQILSIQSAFFLRYYSLYRKCFKNIRKEKEKSCAAGDSA